MHFFNIVVKVSLGRYNETRLVGELINVNKAKDIINDDFSSIKWLDRPNLPAFFIYQLREVPFCRVLSIDDVFPVLLEERKTLAPPTPPRPKNGPDSVWGYKP